MTDISYYQPHHLYSGPTYRDRANMSIAHGALTNSKRPESFIDGVYPTHIAKGEGAYAIMSDGKRYVDFIGANGTALFGYADPLINAAIKKQLADGTLFSLGSTTEVHAAERFQQAIPFIQRLRFLKTGSEACQAACTIARAATGRSLILSEGYHGWHQEFTSLTPPAFGIPSMMGNDIEKFTDLSEINGDVAAVIVEPVQLDASIERKKWLYKLREVCTQHGVVLIFDEIITGFRFPKLCVANYFGVTPDLILLGKAIAGGLPLAVVGGKKEIMCADYFVSSTFGGETLSLAAAIAALDLLVDGRLDKLWVKGALWIDMFNQAFAKVNVRLNGYPTRGAFAGDDAAKALFFQEACDAGFLFGASWFFGFPHQEIDCKNEMEAIAWKISQGLSTLRGQMPRSPFANRARSQ